MTLVLNSFAPVERTSSFVISASAFSARWRFFKFSKSFFNDSTLSLIPLCFVPHLQSLISDFSSVDFGAQAFFLGGQDNQVTCLSHNTTVGSRSDFVPVGVREAERTKKSLRICSACVNEKRIRDLFVVRPIGN